MDSSADTAQHFLAFARAHLERAMQTKPENHAAYSRWIKAHEHILAAAELMKIDGPAVIDAVEWELKELSFGCSQHSGATCCLLKNVHDGRELHIPGHVQRESNG